MATATASPDDIQSLEGQLGDEFGFGFEDDASVSNENSESRPHPHLKLVPPIDVPTKQTATSISLIWNSLSDPAIEKLELHTYLASDFQPDRAPVTGIQVVNIPNPKQIRSITVSNLKPSTEYIFRLAGRSANGPLVFGPNSVPIHTLDNESVKMDKSAWLTLMPSIRKISGVKSIGRRFSIKKQKPMRYYFVLEGALLTWYKSVNGDEVDYIHLSKLREISFPQREDNTTFSLHLTDDRTLEIQCTSDEEGVSDREIFDDWVATLTQVRREVGGSSIQVVHKTVKPAG